MTLSKKKNYTIQIFLLCALVLAAVYVFLDVMTGHLSFRSYGFRFNLFFSIISFSPVILTFTLTGADEVLKSLNPRIYPIIILFFKLFLSVALGITETTPEHVSYFSNSAENYLFTEFAYYIITVAALIFVILFSKYVLRIYSICSGLICLFSAVFYFISGTPSVYLILKESLAVCVDLLFLASLFILDDHLKKDNMFAFSVAFLESSEEDSEENSCNSPDAIYEETLDNTPENETKESSPAKPYSGKEKYIFVSYAHKDSHIVTPIINRLVKEGYRVWYDQRIIAGTEWDESIAAHIYDCGYFAAFISSNYIKSGNCKDELNYARDLNKELLIVYLEETQLPQGLAMRLNRIQSLYMYDNEDIEEFYKDLFDANNINSCKETQKSTQE